MSFRGQLQAPSPPHPRLPSAWRAASGLMEPGCSSVCWRGIWAWFSPPVCGPLWTSNELSASAQKMGANFQAWGREETAVVAQISHRGRFGQLQGEKVELGGRLVSLHLPGYTVSQNPVSSSLYFPFPFHIWQQFKLSFRGKAVISLGWMGFSSGKQRLVVNNDVRP